MVYRTCCVDGVSHLLCLWCIALGCVDSVSHLLCRWCIALVVSMVYRTCCVDGVSHLLCQWCIALFVSIVYCTCCVYGVSHLVVSIVYRTCCVDGVSHLLCRWCIAPVVSMVYRACKCRLFTVVCATYYDAYKNKPFFSGKQQTGYTKYKPTILAALIALILIGVMANCNNVCCSLASANFLNQGPKFGMLC